MPPSCAHLFVIAVCVAASCPARADDTPKADMTLTEACLAKAGDDHAKRACVGIAAEACIATPDGESNVGMGWCLGSEGDWWEARRAAASQALAAAALEADAANRDAGVEVPEVAPRAVAADTAWAAWRDAECAVDEAFWGGGSGTGVAVTACRMTLAAERALRLERLVADYGTR
jgi:uncharacterized protein YecT (DUF1311 family)